MQQQLRSDAATVADLLSEQGVKFSSADAVVPDPQTPLVNGMRVSFRRAIPVTLKLRGVLYGVDTSARTVGALLSQEHVTLAGGDYVLPREDRRIHAGEVIRVVHVTRWIETHRDKTQTVVEHRLSLRLPPLASKTISHGRPGVQERVVQYTRYDDNPKTSVKVIASRVLRAGRPKIVLSGVVAYDRYARLAKRGLRSAERLETQALDMLATAYDPHCYGCSGTTAIGLPAGYGVVAVDPSVIPLGTRLYIKGYGPAVAGDTGGAIIGNRIDLGFNSYAAAARFGKHPVRVFVLK